MTASVEFSGYRFESETGRLWAGAREVRLTPKASEVLKQLVLHAGEPVSKADLFATVWTGTAVSDDALTSCIQELRRALEDNSKQPRFIETRHRRGYRFVAPLSDAAPHRKFRTRANDKVVHHFGWRVYRLLHRRPTCGAFG